MKFLFFGELMLRLTPSRPGVRLDMADTLRMTPGGSEANSAVALSALGPLHDVTFLSALPDNPLGKNCLSKLRALGVKTVLLPSESQRMGLYWLDMGKGPRASDVHYDRANSAFDLINPEAIGKDHLACDWFHSSGITPAISNRTCRGLFRILDLLPEDLPFSLDLNYRSKLWQWADQEEMRGVYENLSQRALLLAGNESDFQTCLGLKGEENLPEDVYSTIAESAFSKYQKLRFLAVSLRDAKSATSNIWSGMLFVRTEGGSKKFISPRIHIDAIIDRLGTGDSFTAGIIHGLNTFGENYKRTIDFAVMLSALKHSIYGDFASFTEEEVFKNLGKSGTGIIER